MSPATSPAPAPAPWKQLFSEHLDALAKDGGSVEFNLATVTAKGLPAARTCIFRGFWTTIPENPYNKLPKNPSVYESDCPTFTTDARRGKAYDIFATGKAAGTPEQCRAGSGGGGPIEAVYWVRETMTQWRVRGKCWLAAADDIEGPSEQNTASATVKSEVGRYMRVVDGQAPEEKEWTWKREIDNHFENLNPLMRGSFKTPPPGLPLGESKGPGEEMGQTAGHLADEPLARRNFRVGIITPEEVESLDLSDQRCPKRHLWTLAEAPDRGGGDCPSTPIGEWIHTETWP